MKRTLYFLLAGFLLTLAPNTALAQQQYGDAGHHRSYIPVEKKGNDDMPSQCEHLQTLVHNHEHEDAKTFIYETLNDNKQQPDCFFYNARLYFNHKLSGSDHRSKPTFDSLMALYDHWFAASRTPNVVLNWKGRDIREFYVKRPDSLRKYCAMYKRIYDSDKYSMHPYNLKVLAFCACDLHGKIDVDSLWHFTKEQAQTHHEGAWKASYKSLKRELIACPRVSCEKLHHLLHPVISSGKEGSEETHHLATLLAKRGCKEGVYVASADQTHATASSIAPSPLTETKKAEPKAAPAHNPVAEKEVKKEEPLAEPEAEPEMLTPFDALTKIAKKHMEDKKYKDALYGFEAAMKSATNPTEKADSYMGMAVAADSLKDYATAKKHAQTMHSLLPDEVEGMKFLAKLYHKAEAICHFNSAKEIAAFYVLMSNVAWNLGNSEEADGWRENANLNELYRTGTAQKGEKVMVGCFINEEVALP